jgi:hypothetical protein
VPHQASILERRLGPADRGLSYQTNGSSKTSKIWWSTTGVPMWTLFPNSEYFRKVLEYSTRVRKFFKKDDGCGRKCCRYIYYVKLVTNAAGRSSLIGEGRTAVFGQKGNTVRVNMGRKLSVLTNSVSSAHTDNGLGHKTQPKLSTFKLLNRNRLSNVLFRLNDDWLFVLYEWSGRTLPAHMRMLSR